LKTSALADILLEAMHRSTGIQTYKDFQETPVNYQIILAPFSSLNWLRNCVFMLSYINTEEKTVSVDLVTGLVEFLNGKISIYPNPVRDILKISGITSPTVASIYNTNGKLMQTRRLNSSMTEINLIDLPSGLYVIKFQTEKNVVVKQFAIEQILLKF
jgi:hypothetical protein